MGSFSIWHWLIVLAVVLLLFGGRGKISQIMGDFGKGMKSFKKGIAEDDDDTSSNSKRVSDDSHGSMSHAAEAQGKKD